MYRGEELRRATVGNENGKVKLADIAPTKMKKKEE